MIPFPSKKYNIIYADPAWYFNTWSKKGMSRSPKYKLMGSREIRKLPVADITDKDCVLFIWIIYPLMEQALKVIKDWGFTYKTCAFNWVKNNKKSDSFFWGMGYWTRSNSEICLIATKGKPKRISRSVHQIIFDRIREHSRKPDCVRDRIVELCGDLPRIELFARQKTKGWDCWGNEI